MSVTYLTPVREQPVALPYDLRVRQGGEALQIGLLSNGFPDTENYLRRQADELQHALPDATFRIETKGARHALSAVIPEPLLESMAETCDAVLIAWGHCGSCTSGVTRDAIAFAKRGIPSVTLICDIFWDYSAWMAGALGMADIPRIRIPYPVAGTGDTAQREVARQIIPAILDGLGVTDAPPR